MRTHDNKHNIIILLYLNEKITLAINENNFQKVWFFFFENSVFDSKGMKLIIITNTMISFFLKNDKIFKKCQGIMIINKESINEFLILSE